MKQILVMLAAAACFVIAVAAHAAAHAAGLRPEVLVTGEQVTLGDLFDGLPAGRTTEPVARAPAPGRSVVLDAGWIARVAQTYGIYYTPARPGRGVVIRRADAAHLAALAAAMREELSGFIAAAPAQAQAQVLAQTAAQAGSVDGGAEAAAEAEPRATTGAEAASPPPPAGESRELLVPMLARRMQRGETIGAADIDWIAIPDDRRAQGVITDADALIGQAPRRPLAAQQPLRADDVQPPTLITRGETVAMLLHSGRLSVATRGRALDSGARGDVIRVLNVDSRRTIEAVVAGPGTVTIRPGASLASLN